MNESVREDILGMNQRGALRRQDRAIVIPSFNQNEQTTRCVAALDSAVPQGLTVIVVDHGDSNWVPPRKSNIAIERLKESSALWWAGATNTGIRHALEAGATSIMLLNADCILDGAIATRLFETAEQLDGVVAPTQRDLETGETLSTGAVPMLILGFPTLFERKKIGGWLGHRTIVSGGRGVVIPAGVFANVGLLADHELSHYWADHDFFIRCRKAGVPIVISPECDVVVDQTRTSTSKEPETLSWPAFLDSLHNPRSHRNAVAIKSFFRRNYPIRSLYKIGSTLYLVRYTVSWALRRLVASIRSARTR